MCEHLSVQIRREPRIGSYPRRSRSTLETAAALSALSLAISAVLLVSPSFGIDRAVLRYTVAFAFAPRVSEAIGIAREERDRIAAEKDAFERFVQRIAAMEPSDRNVTTTPDPSSPAVSLSKSSCKQKPADESSLQAVREVYRETVMDTPHYETDYAESIEQHMATELGPELTRAVTDEGKLLRQVREELLEQSRNAGRERTALLQTIEEEIDDITDGKRTVRTVHEGITSVEDSLYPSDVSGIVDGWTRLETLEDEMRALLRRRQSEIASGTGGMPPHALQRYLYQSRPWTYPILLDGLETVERIDEARDRVVKHIYDW
jgi:hypothetical protein